jgi:hypothetical protein
VQDGPADEADYSGANLKHEGDKPLFYPSFQNSLVPLPR